MQHVVLVCKLAMAFISAKRALPLCPKSTMANDLNAYLHNAHDEFFFILSF